MSEIKCLVCKGTHFRKGYYEIGTDVEILDGEHHEIDSGGDISFYLESEEEERDLITCDDYKDVYKYVCEGCGFIMSFIEEKNVKSYEDVRRAKEEERKRKEEESIIHWKL